MQQLLLFFILIFSVQFSRCNNHTTSGSSTQQSPAGSRIFLQADNITYDCICNGWGATPLSYLTDEQHLDHPQTIYHLPYGDRYDHVRYTITLKDSFQFNAFALFDAAGASGDSVTVYSGSSDHLQYLGALVTGGSNAWLSIPIQAFGHSLVFEVKNRNVLLGEVALYGEKKGNQPSPISTPVTYTAPRMNDFIGINGGLWVRSDLLLCAGAFREYHSAFWNDGGQDQARGYWPQVELSNYPDNVYAFQPDYGSRHTDDDYKKFSDASCELCPCVQLAPLHFVNGGDPNMKPIMKGANAQDPQSYVEHADYLFQFTARYGSKKIAPSRLKLSTLPVGSPPQFQPITSGLNRVKYIENWNEPDKWWVELSKYGREVQFTPFEFAAMCSADYDGNEGSLGENKGIKAADPDAKLVMGGLAALNLDYIKAMKVWSDQHRKKSKKFPADVLNFHHYCTDGSGLFYQDAKTGICPEADSLKAKLKEVVAYRNAELPGVEIWLSEFGYDTDPQSNRRAPAIGNTDAYEVQGQWMLRSYLEMAAAGIDKAFWYMLEDVVSDGPNSRWQYNTCGLVKDAAYPADQHTHASYEKKPSWYYLHGFRDVIGEARFVQELPQNDPSIHVYEFAFDQVAVDTKNAILVVWYGTAENKQASNVKINIGASTNARYFTLTKNEQQTTTSPILLGNGPILSVPKLTEMPAFISISR